MTSNSTSKTSSKPESEGRKRNFDDMEFGYASGQPAPQMSYERSRPQSPANPQSREPSATDHQQQIPQVSATSPPVRQSTDAFMGTSRTNTRPTTPFNTYSYPGTPPDLFLHTRQSPNISQDLWQNYQPDQLFPPDAAMFPIGSPNQTMVDPALRDTASAAPQPFTTPSANMQPSPIPPQQQSQNLQQQQIPQAHLAAANGLQALQQQQPQYQHDPQTWAQLQAMQQQQQQHHPQQNRPEDTWSNSSNSGPIVPTTLNVGDW